MSRKDNDQAVDGAKERSRDADRCGKQQRLAERRALHRGGGEHVADGYHRADGKVDAARNQDHRLRRGGEGQRHGTHREGLRIE